VYSRTHLFLSLRPSPAHCNSPRTSHYSWASPRSLCERNAGLLHGRLADILLVPGANNVSIQSAGKVALDVLTLLPPRLPMSESVGEILQCEDNSCVGRISSSRNRAIGEVILRNLSTLTLMVVRFLCASKLVISTISSFRLLFHINSSPSPLRWSPTLETLL